MQEITNLQTYTVLKNEKYGDYRVDVFVNGEWVDQYDSGWSKQQANKKKDRLEAAYRRLNSH